MLRRMRIAQLARFASENRMRSCAGCHSSRILEPASTSKKSPSCGLCRGTYRGASTPIAGFGRILAGPHVGCWASAHDMSRLANRGKVSAAAPRPTKPRVRRTRGSECGGAWRGGRSRFQGKRDVPAVKCAGAESTRSSGLSEPSVTVSVSGADSLQADASGGCASARAGRDARGGVAAGQSPRPAASAGCRRRCRRAPGADRPRRRVRRARRPSSRTARRAG